MISDALKIYLEDYLKTDSLNFSVLTGGDINHVYKITTDTTNYAIKVNSSGEFPSMFQKEAIGLIKLKNAKAIRIPEVLHYNTTNKISFILLEYITPTYRSKGFWHDFGKQLASLHKNSVDYYGFECDNYIGNLVQQNNEQPDAVTFYISERLEPQIKLATGNGFSFKNIGAFYNNLKNMIPDEPSSLIHGDLWNGNYLVDEHGYPCLIDPAVCYAPREMDIAMMHLFGGFDNEVFSAYQDMFPLQSGWKKRLELWQLYYLLVHLNIFGSGYYQSVERIIKKYS